MQRFESVIKCAVEGRPSIVSATTTYNYYKGRHCTILFIVFICFVVGRPLNVSTLACIRTKIQGGAEDAISAHDNRG